MDQVIRTKGYITTTLCFVILLAAASLLYGLPAGGGEVEYYSDAALTNQVGYWYWACNVGNSTHWGIKTGYYIVLDEFSCQSQTGGCTYRSHGYWDGEGVWHDLGSGIECHE